MIIGVVGSHESFGPLKLLQGVFVFSFFALIFCGVQSICYTLLMEFAFARGLRRRSWQAIAYSTLLGILSGASFMLYSSSGVKMSSLLFFCSIGALVGLVISSIIFWREPHEKEKPA